MTDANMFAISVVSRICSILYVEFHPNLIPNELSKPSINSDVLFLGNMYLFRCVHLLFFYILHYLFRFLFHYLDFRNDFLWEKKIKKPN